MVDGTQIAMQESPKDFARNLYFGFKIQICLPMASNNAFGSV